MFRRYWLESFDVRAIGGTFTEVMISADLLNGKNTDSLLVWNNWWNWTRFANNGLCKDVFMDGNKNNDFYLSFDLNSGKIEIFGTNGKSRKKKYFKNPEILSLSLSKYFSLKHLK